MDKIKLLAFALIVAVLSACNNSTWQPEIDEVITTQAGSNNVKSFRVVFTQAMNKTVTEPSISIFIGKYSPLTNPSSFTPLTLTSTCNGQFVVKNTNTSALSFNWDVVSQSEKGFGVVPANGQTTFYTSVGSKTARVLVGSQLQQSAVNKSTACTSKPFSVVWSSDNKTATLNFTSALTANIDFTLVVSTLAKTSTNIALLSQPLGLSITTKNALEDRAIPFNGTEAQTAWTIVKNHPNLSLYSLSFNLPEAGAYKDTNGDINFIVPESNTTSLVVAGVRAGKAIAIWRFAFDIAGDKLFVSNVLSARNTVINNMSKLRPVGSKILSLANPTATAGLANQLKPMVQNPGFTNPACATTQSACKTALQDYNAKVDSYANAAAFGVYNLISIFGVSPVNPQPKIDINNIPGTLADWATAATSVFAPFYGSKTPWVWKTATVSIGVNTAVLFNVIRTAGNALDSYNSVLACARANDANYKSGTAYIALTSIPLPFSYQVFVQSLPDKINLGTGYLRPGYTDQNVANILTSAIPNAEIVWELFTDTVIVPNTTQIDVKLKAISTSYASRQCLP